jgi:hypothetical protein
LIRATLVFVPPGGGEADYSLDFDLPAVPQPGDYVSIVRGDRNPAHYEDFIVRRTWWHLEYPDSALGGSREGSLDDVVVVIEGDRVPDSGALSGGVEDLTRALDLGEVNGEADDTIHGHTKGLMVECEFAVGPYSTDDHKRAAGPNAQRFEDTAF